MTVMSLDDVSNMPPLTEDDIRTIRDAKPVPTDDCPAMTSDELKQFRPWYDRQKQPISIDIDVAVVNYFKRLAVDAGVSYQELMKMFLTECAHKKEKPVFRA